MNMSVFRRSRLAVESNANRNFDTFVVVVCVVVSSYGRIVAVS